MGRFLWIGCLCVACSSGDAAKLAPAAPDTPPAITKQAPAPAAAPSATGDSACAHASLQTLDLELGVAAKTPWELELTYAIDDDRKLGPGFLFMLQSGPRRWETRRDGSNWSKPLLWHGYCWRGGTRPALRAKHLQVQVAPLCRDGKLVESGSCTPAFAP